jgi:nicotinate dehydrogenase FAD-subunit
MSVKNVYKAKNVEEVIDLLDQYKGKSKLIAGGTDIVIDLRHHKISPEVLIDISSVEEMTYIKEVGEYIEMGAAATFTAIAGSDVLGQRLFGLKEAAHSVGSPQIRNKGTVGGNICNGSPAADTVPPLLALDTIATIKSKNSEREILVEDLFLDKGKVDIKDNEVLVSLRFKKPNEKQILSFSKLGLRKALAISRICTSVFIEFDEDNICKDIRIANGSLGKHGIREKAVEEFFKGKKLTEEIVAQGAELMQSQVQERLAGRSTVGFKSVAVKGVLKDAIDNAIKLYK